MNKNIVHEIGNCLHQIISDAEHIVSNDEMFEYGEKIKTAAYKIDALITDSAIEKQDIDISKNSTNSVDLKQFVGMNVLIVDDVLENIHIMENIFNTLSCNIISAQNGEEALEVFKNGFVPEIVCMDIMMPGIDGPTATKELKKLGCEAYFIAISALKNQPNSVVSLFNCWLPKPFTIEHIIGALAGYKIQTTKEVKSEIYKLDSSIDASVKDELLRLAKNGAYSELNRLISTLKASPSKEFLIKSLKKIDFNAIIKSIVSS
ncbi:MAG: response regulator [Campylobacterota bacterium]|nr:response regulator [Campylobacterota bacterium]